jgi:lipopolysaccharide/colanic/teichoic acid biosynthesis glycosyltransferase
MYNIILGDMSLVGPRPQVSWAVNLYTLEERQLLDVRPGITGYASIRFRNEAELLRGHIDADEAYLKNIAPLKNKLALCHVGTASFLGDLRILWMTIRTALLRYQVEGSDDGKG